MEVSISQKIAAKLPFSVKQIQTVGALLAEGATIPFLSRYRKEVTGGLDEEQLRILRDEITLQQELADRKAFVLESIRKQGKLTPELQTAIEDCTELVTLEDLYLPYKPKRKTRATAAREKGLEPLAQLMWDQKTKSGNKKNLISPFVNAELGVGSVEDALAGAKDICAEWMNEHAGLRAEIRAFFKRQALVKSKKLSTVEGRTVYESYYEFEIPARHIKPHQVLALNRGERENVLLVSVACDQDEALSIIEQTLLLPDDSLFIDELIDAFEDGYSRLLFPALERELRAELTTAADQHAISTFATNVKNLLMQPPLGDKTVMGIDPAFRTGCKIAVVDPTGKYLEGTVIYPTEPNRDLVGSARTLEMYIRKFGVNLIAIGNGTASRETEQFVADYLRARPLNDKGETIQYLIVSEAGASVYSASDIARQEFPDLDATQRGNISIARRVLDPLAELVKIDPKSIGVGLYQHDVNQTSLGKSLDDVVESCVNSVGVNLNTASAPLLTHVSGLSKTVAENIIKLREQKGRFSRRTDLLDVPGLGPFRYEQSAGFLRIPDGVHVLDNTAIHPESYMATEKLLALVGCSLNDLRENPGLVHLKIKNLNTVSAAEKLDIGLPTLSLIIENLLKPGRDPRENLQKPLLRSDILKAEDLIEGQYLEGTIRNVVDFGAFIDIGVKEDGLLHISKMNKDGRRVTNPHELFSVGDIVKVKIESIDKERGRIALSL